MNIKISRFLWLIYFSVGLLFSACQSAGINLPLPLFSGENPAKQVQSTVIYAGTLEPKQIFSPTPSEDIKLELTTTFSEELTTNSRLTETAEVFEPDETSINNITSIATVSPESTEIFGGILTSTITGINTMQVDSSITPTIDGIQGFQGFVTTPPIPTSTTQPTKTPIELPPWMAASLTATDPRTFKLASGKLQLVQFFAFWDGNSQAMAPYLHSLEEEYKGKIKFVYLDIDDPLNYQHKKDLRYRYQPHYFLIDEQGKVIQQWLGYVKVEKLIEAIEAVLT